MSEFLVVRVWKVEADGHDEAMQKTKNWNHSGVRTIFLPDRKDVEKLWNHFLGD